MRKTTLLKSLFLLCVFVVGSSAWAQTYKKVTSAPSDWSGEYLIVYENSTTVYVWTGIDANSNYSTATISNSIITKPTSAASVTIASMNGGYSIKVNGGTNDGKYISGTSGSNTTNFGTSAVANSLTYSSGVDIASNTSHFVFNSTSGTTRFRYYKSSTYSGSAYKKPQLYKKAYTVTYDANGGTGTMTDSNSPYFGGSTVTTMTNSFENSGYVFTGWNTSADGGGTSYSEGTTFTINANTTLYAQWTIASKVATPSFKLLEGTYYEVQNVEIECRTPNSTIYYTIDGTDPTTSSAVYSSAIPVNETITIKAFAIADGLDNSDIASATYTLKCATPTIEIAPGVFVSSKVVTMSSTDGATIRYTTDGTEPTPSTGTVYNSSNKPSISANTTIKAIATKSGWSNSEVSTQTFTKETVLNGLSALVAQTNTSDQYFYVDVTNAQVTWVNNSNGFMEDASTGIYLEGASPTLNTVYNGIIYVKYKKDGGMPKITESITEIEASSSVVSAKAPTVMTPSALDESFTANLGRQIKIEYFTVHANDKKLTDNITLYGTSPFVGVSNSKTYTLVGYPYKTTNTTTFRVTEAYLKPEAPQFSTTSKDFYEAFNLTLSCTTTGVTMYYTTDGSDPTIESTEYNSSTGIIIPAESTTIKAIAMKDGMISDIATATYTFYSVKQPTFGTTSGTAVYFNDKVVVSCETTGSSLYYTLTTNGNEPADPTSDNYEYPDGGIAITANTVKIKVIAKSGDSYSPVAEATYTLKNPEAPAIDLAAGAVLRNSEVTISSAEGTTIKYSTDGSDPTTSAGSNRKTITITEAITVKAIAVDGAGNESSVASAEYTIIKVEKPTFTLEAGVVEKGSTVELNCATEGATIRYTIDGTTEPTPTIGTEYTEPIAINENLNIKAIAYKDNCDNSDVVTATYTAFVGDIVTFTAGTDVGSTSANESSDEVSKLNVTISGDDAAFATDEYRLYKNSITTISTTDGKIKKVEFTCTKNGTTKYGPGCFGNGAPSGYTYEINGNKGTWEVNLSAEPPVTPATSLSFTATDNQVRATLIKVYVARTAAPTFTVGDYSGTKKVAISSATEGSTIYYTTDGTTPTTSSTLYSGEIAVNENTTLKAIAIYDGISSPVSTATCNIVNLAVACTDGTKYYGTYSNSSAFVVPSDLTVSTISVVDDKLALTNYATNDVVKANTGVLVSSTTSGNHIVILSDQEGTENSDNMLKPSGDAGITAATMEAADANCLFYRLTMHKDLYDDTKPLAIGFWWGAEDGAAFAINDGYKAYLAVPEAKARTAGFSLFGDGETTGVKDLKNSRIEELKSVYNLNGQRVSQPTKGLYIVNGKKTMVK